MLNVIWVQRVLCTLVQSPRYKANFATQWGWYQSKKAENLGLDHPFGSGRYTCKERITLLCAFGCYLPDSKNCIQIISMFSFPNSLTYWVMPTQSFVSVKCTYIICCDSAYILMSEKLPQPRCNNLNAKLSVCFSSLLHTSSIDKCYEIVYGIDQQYRFH